ncbi:MAG TPA: hypothetical protein VIR34_05215, partial [Gemmatimonadaceae bacterium]
PALSARDGSRAGRARRSSAMTPAERCARPIAVPVGLHRTTADSAGQVWSDVDELYRLELGLEDPDTWRGVDVTRGWTSEVRDDARWLSAYGRAGGRRSAFVRIPEKRAVIIVLTDDDAADARGIAGRIAERLVSDAR